MNDSETYPFDTLPDLLRPGLDLVFVGINPSVYAVRHGHYFARHTNRFWPAFSRSRLSATIRMGLGRSELYPEDDNILRNFGIGFTDVVKVPSNSAATLKPADFDQWTPQLVQKLQHYLPRVACFHGLTGYRPFLRYGLKDVKTDPSLGAQPHSLGSTRLFVVPNPSPANAHFRLEDQIEWYDRLAEFLKEPA